MPERSNGTVSKTVVRATVPRVRIPLFPPSPAEAFSVGGLRFFTGSFPTAAGFGRHSPLRLTKNFFYSLLLVTPKLAPPLKL